MGLSSGTKIGPYEIVSPLGAGGMGEVYRARDTKLNRDVALKVLPETLSHDAQRMARFEREAQLLASLSQPNIATIHGLEDSGNIRALVMELVEGQTLAEIIAARHAVPVSDALPMAKQITEALEYAHDHGIIHRDLKPANVKVTPDGTVKVLDFGLAKALDVDASGSNLSNSPTLSPTLSVAATQAGVILGTAAYMSPEQAKAKNVDRRTDIWAFGCVLFEMLTGKRTFEGEDLTETVVALMRNEPDWEALPADTPPRIKELIRRCLAKDPKQRLQAIGDARIAIEEVISGVGAGLVPARTENVQGRPQGSPLRRALPWAVAGLLAAALIGSVVLGKFSAPAPQPVIRFTVPAPENMQFPDVVGSMMSVSPDGKQVAFMAQPRPDAPPTLWVRALDSLTARQIQEAEGGAPFWSPDGQYIGFSTNAGLEKVAFSGGPPQTLCAASVVRGATWNPDGTILFSSRGSLYSLPEAGGTPVLVVSPDKAHGETGYVLPQFLPGGRHFIFTIVGKGFSVGAGLLGSKKITHLVAADSDALYAPPGELLYLTGSTLMARPFDANTLRFTGQAVPIAENVGQVQGAPYAYFSVSPSGVLAYQTALSVKQNRMAWFNRDGKELGKLGPPGIYECPAISPDGTKVAMDVGPEGKADIWVYDLKRGTGSRLTFNPAYDFNPVWSSDGKRIFFSSERKGQRDIYEKASNGLGTTQLVYASKVPKSLNDVSPDGRYAIYDTGGAATQELGVLPLGGDHKPFAFVQGKFSAANAQFSPNGHYLAYASNETGRSEVYVQTFPEHLGKWQISTAGGVDPVWGHDGKELYYLDPKNQLMAAQVDTHSPTFQAGIPKALFQAHIMPPSYWRSNFVVSPDSQRFLMLMPPGETKPSPITVVVNWPALLKKP